MWSFTASTSTAILFMCSRLQEQEGMWPSLTSALSHRASICSLASRGDNSPLEAVFNRALHRMLYHSKLVLHQRLGYVKAAINELDAVLKNLHTALHATLDCIRDGLDAALNCLLHSLVNGNQPLVNGVEFVLDRFHA
mmetsp:Transcript_4863/g.10720  ORF Transcript_4863/g.10720 Transcript_4863/m.10720 type:complete len:138 (+) Transcript_4863:250-663(+)